MLSVMASWKSNHVERGIASVRNAAIGSSYENSRIWH
jgi:hypothetical protein